jgi:L-amino acid N-acyltransferase YncA
MSLYSDYIRERLGQETIEHEWGFLTYRIFGESMELYDIYIAPEERRSKKAWRIVDEAAFRARQAGAKRFVSSIFPSAEGSSASMSAHLRYGFKLHSAGPDRIIMTKELTED